jgi:hypothetical protein
MKNVLFAILQFVLFLALFFVGSFFGPLYLQMLHNLPSDVTLFANGTRGFHWDGVILMLILFALILAIEAARKRLRFAAPWTAAALIAATMAGLVMKFGFFHLDS